MEETRELDQTGTEDSGNEDLEKPETEAPRTEEPETDEHDVPYVPDIQDADRIENVVIIVEEKENKKETQSQTDNNNDDRVEESISQTGDAFLVEADPEEDFSSESDENAASETQPESEKEESFVDVMSDISDSSSDVLESETEPETESTSETETIILMNNDVDASVEYLHSIDLKLSCIIFILLFSICERKLRYGVRALCGKPIKD